MILRDWKLTKNCQISHDFFQNMHKFYIIARSLLCPSPISYAYVKDNKNNYIDYNYGLAVSVRWVSVIHA